MTETDFSKKAITVVYRSLTYAWWGVKNVTVLRVERKFELSIENKRFL